jgi:Putative Flp pilus-assembly TadE/G-like
MFTNKKSGGIRHAAGAAFQPHTECAGYVMRLHRDERGSMSIVSVFAVLFLLMLLGMVINVGRHVDGKLQIQNAADSAAYSGGVVLARGMNTLAFTNNLLCEVFAVTAILRESQAGNSASNATQVLASWSKMASVLQSSGIPKFSALGSSIQQQVTLEQDMVNSYSAWAKSVSEQTLPLMEQILSQELIPQYQRAVVLAFPEIAQKAAQQTALTNGSPDHGRGSMLGVLWRTDGQPVGANEATYSPSERTLPVVDPELDSLPSQSECVATAVKQRWDLSHWYLDEWNAHLMSGFDAYARLSQFGNFWRSFTCGYLENLLKDEYPKTNLPMVIYEDAGGTLNPTTTLAKHYSFVSVVYWKKMSESAPGLFKSPLQADDQAYAEVHLFIPQKRPEWVEKNASSSNGPTPLGGVPGQTAYAPACSPAGSSGGSSTSGTGAAHWVIGLVGGPPKWNLLNQSWNCQLAPATQTALPAILQASPDLTGSNSVEYQTPNLGGLSGEELQQISPH